jgi:hypothetical protein
VIVSTREDVKRQIAVYEHGSRNVYVSPGIGGLLQKALGHEMAHGVDDIFGSPHYFAGTPEWQSIHRRQSNFDIQKYADEPLEFFADMVVKNLLIGRTKMSITNPDETNYIWTAVFPILAENFNARRIS